MCVKYIIYKKHRNRVFRTPATFLWRRWTIDPPPPIGCSRGATVLVRNFLKIEALPILLWYFRFLFIFFWFWWLFFSIFFIFFCVIFDVLTVCGVEVWMVLCRFWHFLCRFQRLLYLGGIFPCLGPGKCLKTAILQFWSCVTKKSCWKRRIWVTFLLSCGLCLMYIIANHGENHAKSAEFHKEWWFLRYNTIE